MERGRSRRGPRWDENMRGLKNMVESESIAENHVQTGHQQSKGEPANMVCKKDRRTEHSETLRQVVGVCRPNYTALPMA